MRATRVLLVEDNNDNRTIYVTYLEHHGYTVIDTANGRDALELALREKPDIVLLDISIPGMDGWTLTRRLKESSETGHIPVIALTAHSLPEHRERARQVGCDAYLAKPVEPNRVLKEIQRLLNGRI